MAIHYETFGTPCYWNNRAKIMIDAGEFNGKELIETYQKIINEATQFASNPPSANWTGVCHCLIQGYLTYDGVAMVLQQLVEKRQSSSIDAMTKKKLVLPVLNYPGG